MPTGEPYFAWVQASETAFGAQHLRWDEDILEVNVAQAEGEFATFNVVVRNPRVGPLAPGRPIHAWFAIDCGGGNLFKIFGRLVGVPSNLIGNTVEFEFIARPTDYNDQKAALAESLKVRPYYDLIFVDPQRAEDPDIVLEAYPKRWHIDRETHAVTVSGEVEPDDGTLAFGPDDMIFDGLAMNLTGSPATAAEIDCVFSWTQMHRDGIDMTPHIAANWPNEFFAGYNVITSFTLGASQWPQAGASIGDGWTVLTSSTTPLYDLTVRNRTDGGKTIYKWANGSTTELESSSDIQYIGNNPRVTLGSVGSPPPGSIIFSRLVTRDASQVQYGDDGSGGREVVSFSRDYSQTITVVPLLHTAVELIVTYNANRPFTEHVTFTLVADVQPVLTEPEDGGVIRLNDLRSVNLSEPIDDGSATEIPMVDTRRRSFVVTERGQTALLHLLALARATLLRAARVVEITFEPLLSRMHEVTLRKSATVTDSRIPGGMATGKIVAYSLKLNGDTGEIATSATIGCCVGRGGVGTITEVVGDPEYVEDDYIAQAEDYQEYDGRVVVLDEATGDVGLTLPLFNPNDDGVDFLAGLTLEDVLEVPLTVTFGPAEQRAHLNLYNINQSRPISEQVIEDRSTQLQNALRLLETQARFKLKSMTGEFDTEVPIEVTGLKIPQQINLEAP